MKISQNDLSAFPVLTVHFPSKPVMGCYILTFRFKFECSQFINIFFIFRRLNFAKSHFLSRHFHRRIPKTIHVMHSARRTATFSFSPKYLLPCMIYHQIALTPNGKHRPMSETGYVWRIRTPVEPTTYAVRFIIPWLMT